MSVSGEHARSWPVPAGPTRSSCTHLYNSIEKGRVTVIENSHPRNYLLHCREGSAFGNANIEPKLAGLEVRFEPILEVAFKVGDIQSVFVELKDIG